MGDSLTDIELLVLLAIMRLGDEAYGVAISRDIERASKRSLSLATIYSVLERLERIGLVTSTLGDSTPERGGRPKRFFRVTRLATARVRATRRGLMRMWQDLPQLEGGRA